jgi:hypothetical protein
VEWQSKNRGRYWVVLATMLWALVGASAWQATGVVQSTWLTAHIFWQEGCPDCFPAKEALRAAPAGAFTSVALPWLGKIALSDPSLPVLKIVTRPEDRSGRRRWVQLLRHVGSGPSDRPAHRSRGHPAVVDAWPSIPARSRSNLHDGDAAPAIGGAHGGHAQGAHLIGGTVLLAPGGVMLSWSERLE